MKSSNIPEVKLGIVAVSRDCFPILLSPRSAALPSLPPAPPRALICTSARPLSRTSTTCKKPWPKSPPQAATR